MTVKAEGQEGTIINHGRWSAYVPDGGRPSGVEVLNRGQRNETKSASSVGQEDGSQRVSRDNPVPWCRWKSRNSSDMPAGQ